MLKTCGQIVFYPRPCPCPILSSRPCQNSLEHGRARAEARARAREQGRPMVLIFPPQYMIEELWER